MPPLQKCLECAVLVTLDDYWAMRIDWIRNFQLCEDFSKCWWLAKLVTSLFGVEHNYKHYKHYCVNSRICVLQLCKRQIVVPRQWRCGLWVKDCEWLKDWRGEGSQGWGSTTRIGEVWGVHCKMYLSKIQKVFVPIARCVCPNDKMYLSLLLNVKLQKWRIVGASAVRVKLNNKERRSGLCVKKRNPRRYSRW